MKRKRRIKAVSFLKLKSLKALWLVGLGCFWRVIYTVQVTYITKTITCIDCGEEVEVNAKDNNTERCDECYETYRRNKVKENVRRYRERNKDKNM